MPFGKVKESGQCPAQDESGQREHRGAGAGKREETENSAEKMEHVVIRRNWRAWSTLRDTAGERLPLNSQTQCKDGVS